MSNTPPSSRPKIEVVRLPSYEQAKLRPLLEGGIQLQAQFKHVRYGDYVSYSSLEDGNKQYFRFHDRECKTPLTTKSLDNIFARQLTFGAEEQQSPFLWRDATRSEEQLYHAPHAFPGAACPKNKASRFSGARSHITALLKKLSPRPRHKAALPNSSCPWVVVEFSKKDLESPDAAGRANSFCSDHSFDMAVHATRLRGEEAAKNESNQGQAHNKPVNQGEGTRHRSAGAGLCAAKHRTAFNTGGAC